MPVGPCGVRVGYHNLGIDRFAGNETHAARRTILHDYLANLRVAAERATVPLDQPDQAFDQPPRAAQRKMHAPAALQECDQAIDRACRERIAADQEWVEAEHDTQALIAKKIRHQAEDATIARQLDHFRRDPRHVGPAAERHVAQALETDLEYLLARLHVSVVTIDIAWRKPRDLAAHRVSVAGIIEMRTVLKADAIKRQHRHQRHVVGHFSSTQLPQLLEQKRRGDDRWPCIESEAILPVDVGAATG